LVDLHARWVGQVAGGGQTYAATLEHGLGGGIEAGVQLGRRARGWLGSYLPQFTAHVTGSARLGFVYERPTRQDAERILQHNAAPHRGG
jgi:hypothetical protein